MLTETSAGRFAVPAFLAAAGHVLLLWAYPDLPPRIVFVPLVEAVATRPAIQEPAIVELRVEPSVSEPVRAMSAGPVRPVTEDRSIPTRVGFEIEQPRPGWRPDAAVSLDKIPDGFGENAAGPRGAEGFARDGFISVVNLDRTPRARLQVAPDYPAALRQAGVEGEVVVEFEVDASGAVVSARALRGREKEFADAAVRAVTRWRFEPGRKGGRVVPFRMLVPISFRLGSE